MTQFDKCSLIDYDVVYDIRYGGKMSCN
jgi:hypothetical protein